ESRLFDLRENRTRVPGRHRVRLDNGKRSFCHFPNFCFTFSPISAGDSQTAIPASSIAFILSDALPQLPEMIAPACPMPRPGGAVCPAMNPTTGFFTLALM